MSQPAPAIDVKKFRETAAKVIQQRAQPFPKLAKELDALQDELDALEKAGTDKKAIAEARKKRDAKRKEMEDCMRNLEVQKAITQPIPKPADPEDRPEEGAPIRCPRSSRTSSSAKAFPSAATACCSPTSSSISRRASSPKAAPRSSGISDGRRSRILGAVWAGPPRRADRPLRGLTRARLREPSITARLNAGMSSGLRLVTRLPSTTVLAIDPVGAGVAQVGLQRRPRGHLAAARSPGLDDQPGAVADGADRLAGIEERLDEGHRLRLHAQPVRVHHAAGQQQGVVVIGLRSVEPDVDRDRLAPVGVVPTADPVALRRDDARAGAGGIERLARLDQLGLLEAVLGEDGDAQVLQFLGQGGDLLENAAGGMPAAGVRKTRVRRCVQNRRDEMATPGDRPPRTPGAASRMPGAPVTRRKRTMDSTIEAGRFGSGHAVHRIEDEALLAGRGRFTDDVAAAGQAHIAFLRSPHAHARIRSLDADAARGAPGVLAVYTGAELAAAGVKPIPPIDVFRRADGSPLATPARRALAHEVVRFVGEPVAAVVAESREAARDACEAIFVDYEELPAVTDPVAATAPGAPALVAAAPDNIAAEMRHGDAEATRKAFEAAAHTVSLGLVNQRLAPSAIEPRSVLAEFDAASGRLTMRLSTQMPTGVMTSLLDAIPGLAPGQVRVVVGDVGGGFGMKTGIYPEDTSSPGPPAQLQRPVRWRAERSEDLLAAVHGRDQSSAAPSSRSTPTAGSWRCACARSPTSAPTRPPPASSSSC